MTEVCGKTEFDDFGLMIIRGRFSYVNPNFHEAVRGGRKVVLTINFYWKLNRFKVYDKSLGDEDVQDHYDAQVYTASVLYMQKHMGA